MHVLWCTHFNLYDCIEWNKTIIIIIKNTHIETEKLAETWVELTHHLLLSLLFSLFFLFTGMRVRCSSCSVWKEAWWRHSSIVTRSIGCSFIVPWGVNMGLRQCVYNCLATSMLVSPFHTNQSQYTSGHLKFKAI